MKYSHVVLSNKEREIMEVLWDSDKPLTVSDICDYGENMDIPLNQSTVQITVNKLVKKGYICVGEIVQNHRVLARAFKPKVTSVDLAVMQIQSIVDSVKESDKSSFMSAVMQSNIFEFLKTGDDSNK